MGLPEIKNRTLKFKTQKNKSRDQQKMNVIVTYQEILFATARQDIMTDQADQRDAD
jgi:hypothetical protein